MTNSYKLCFSAKCIEAHVVEDSKADKILRIAFFIAILILSLSIATTIVKELQ